MKCSTIESFVVEDGHAYGPAVAALSDLSGLSREAVALQMTAVLAGLGGAATSVVSAAGEVHRVRLNTIILGADDPRQARLSELLLSPARYLQNDLLNLSRRVPREVLNQLAQTIRSEELRPATEAEPADDEASDYLERRAALQLVADSQAVAPRSSPWQRQKDYELWQQSGSPGGYWDGKPFVPLYGGTAPGTLISPQGAQAMEQPLILMELVSGESIRKHLEQVHLRSPLVIDDGSLLEVAGSRSKSGLRELAESILADQVLLGGQGKACCSVRLGRAALISTVSKERLGECLKQGRIQRLLQSTLIAEPEPLSDLPESVDLSGAEPGYTVYRQAVHSVLSSRRQDIPGIAVTLPIEAAQQLFQGQQQLNAEIMEVSELWRCYLSKLAHLPASILWALRISDPSSDAGEQVAAALYLTRYALSRHLSELQELMVNEQVAVELDRAEEMLRKLSIIAPCSFRDLIRKYAVQTKAVHEPVLEHLIETGKVVRLESGELDLDGSEQSLAG